jgi:DNA polymerase elongation subunit (family B)
MALRYNLSFDTIECSCCKDDPLAKVPKDVLVSRLGDKPIDRDYWVCRKRKGTFVKFLDELTKLRLEYKRDKRPEFKDINKVLSDGLKILINGGYGCFGTKYFDFVDTRVAELVTAYGRYTLKKIMEIAKSSKYSLDVIYGDTDSIFVQGDNATNNDVIKKFISEVNAALNIELEDDKLFKKVIIAGKKRYMGVYFDTEKKQDDIIVKGLEGGKNDRPPLINRMFQQFVDDFESDVNPWTNISRELKRLVNKELQPEDFKVEIQLGYDPDHYDVNDVKYQVGTYMHKKAKDMIWYYKIHNDDTDRARALEKRDGGSAAYHNPANISYEKMLADIESTFEHLLKHLDMTPSELFEQYREEVPKDMSDPHQGKLDFSISGGRGAAAA